METHFATINFCKNIFTIGNILVSEALETLIMSHAVLFEYPPVFVNIILLLDVHAHDEDGGNLVALCKWEGKTVAVVDAFEMIF
jgi:hypothetical protein